MNEVVEREDIERLLPWYVTGRLGRADTSKVESYLSQHPDMLTQLDLIRAERQETVRANEAIGWPPSSMLDRLMASLPPTLARRSGRWVPSLVDFFTLPTARGVQWAAFVAALLVLAQAALITSLLVRGSDQTYQVASSASQADGLSALIAFSDDAKAPAIERLLAEFDANIVDGPKPGGVYKIRLRTLDKSRPTQDALLRKLAERRDVVRIVLPSRD
jgi:anti-sigma factor RsiW